MLTRGHFLRTLLHSTLLLPATTATALAKCDFGFWDELRAPRHYVVQGPEIPLNVPRDGPDKKTLFTEYLPVTGSTLKFWCKDAERVGMQLNPDLAAQPDFDTTLFRLKDLGIALQFFTRNGDGWRPVLLSPQSTAVNKTEDWDFSMPSLVIVKTGPIKEGAIIPAGHLGSVVTQSGFRIADYHLARPIRIVAGACTTPDVNVDMGREISSRRFQHVGDSSRTVEFEIALYDCPGFLNSINYEIRPNTSLLDSHYGLVALDATSSAKGLALQVMSNNVPLVFNKTHQAAYPAGAGSFRIPFSAAYYQTAASIQAGTANTSLSFIMTYQ